MLPLIQFSTLCRSQYVHHLLLSTLSDIEVRQKSPEPTVDSGDANLPTMQQHEKNHKVEGKIDGEAAAVVNTDVSSENVPQSVQVVQQQSQRGGGGGGGGGGAKPTKLSSSSTGTGKPALILGTTDRRNRNSGTVQSGNKNRELKSSSSISSRDSGDSR